MISQFDPSCSDRALLYKAARIIEANAKALKEVHSLNGRWQLWIDCDRVAKADYEHDMHLVRELRARARMADTDRTP